MSFNEKLEARVGASNSLLCVGLDPVLAKLPKHLQDHSQPFVDFNNAIVDATAPYAGSMKWNEAFYAAKGAEGITQLRASILYARDHYPDMPLLLDAKRIDIGNTNKAYVDYFFKYLGVDAVTLPAMLGGAPLDPKTRNIFLNRKDKGLIFLCRTSNEYDEESRSFDNAGEPTYMKIARTVMSWNVNNNCSLVVAANHPEDMARVRAEVGSEMPFLSPGSGAQGGKLAAAVQAGVDNSGTGLMLNLSRSINYASKGPDFAEAAAIKAEESRDEINDYRQAA